MLRVLLRLRVRLADLCVHCLSPSSHHLQFALSFASVFSELAVGVVCCCAGAGSCFCAFTNSNHERSGSPARTRSSQCGMLPLPTGCCNAVPALLLLVCTLSFPWLSSRKKCAWAVLLCVYRRVPKFSPFGEKRMHALKGLACRKRVAAASSPAATCKQGATRLRLRQAFSRMLRSQNL